ncbi:unnamed protein product, partial [Pylaiella littoralis]
MTITLNYFGIPGRAEATRIALAYAGKEFDDNIMGFPEYGKSKWAGKGLPVLEMDGKEYTQSMALLRYAGKLGGLYPEDPLTALKVDEIVSIAEDVMAQLFKTSGASDDSIAKEILDGKVKTLLEVLIGKIKDNKSSTQFCVGDSLTIAELQVHAMILNIEAGFMVGVPTTLIADSYPALMEKTNTVMLDPKV